jgi:hypothetical protein
MVMEALSDLFKGFGLCSVKERGFRNLWVYGIKEVVVQSLIGRHGYSDRNRDVEKNEKGLS